jgi:hypothetical protein
MIRHLSFAATFALSALAATRKAIQALSLPRSAPLLATNLVSDCLMIGKEIDLSETQRWPYCLPWPRQ